MSLREWESGEIKIPSDQWAGFKKALRQAYNEALAEDLKLAETAISAVKARYKGKRNVNWPEVLRQELGAEDPSSRSVPCVLKARYVFKVLDSYQIRQHVVVSKTKTGKDDSSVIVTKLGSLKKKDFPAANGTVLSFNVAYEGSIVLDDKTKTVKWAVSEGNHACDHCRDSHIGRAFFRLLSRLQWKRNSGGYICGNNENNDGRDVGDRANIMHNRYGPLGEKAFEESFPEMSRRSRRR